MQSIGICNPDNSGAHLPGEVKGLPTREALKLRGKWAPELSDIAFPS